MKKTIVSVKTLGVAVLCALVAVIPSLTSCRNEKSVDVSDLLSTVPSSAGAVVGINLSSLLEKAGCKVEGSTIIPGNELKQALDASELQSKAKDGFRLLLSGESGIDPTGAIIFTDAYDTYFTGVVADTDKFREFVQQQTELPFTDAADNVQTSGAFAISGAQMWLSLSSSTTIDAKAVRNYTKLDQAQSFSSLDIAKPISTMTHDVVGYGQVKNFTRSGMSISNAATVNLFLGLLFDNASALSFDLDFLKGQTKMKTTLLNDKGQTAKFLLPANKISLDEVKRLPATANAIVAVALTKDLINKVSDMAKSLGGSLPPQISSSLASLDGTTAIALGNIDNPAGAMTAVIATDGNPSLDFMQILSQLGSTQKDGKIVKVTKGEVAGSLEVAKAAEKFKGASLGIAATANSDFLNGNKLGINSGILTFNSDNGGLSLNVLLETTEPDVNALLTLIKSSVK